MRRFVTSDGLTLAYRDEGAGLPVLCLAGLTRNGEDFSPVAERYATRARIIRLDSRGRGASDFDPDFRNYTVLREMQDALALLDHLGLARAVIFGTSRGGLIAMAMAGLAPERLTAVILNDIGPELDPAGLTRIMGYVGVVPPFATLAAAAEVAALQPQFPGVTAAEWVVHLGRIWRETPNGLALRYDPALRDAVLDHTTLMAGPDLWPLFDALAGVPLMLVRGANSDILTAETAALMQARRPDMVSVTVANRGHVPFLDEPEVVAALDAFLAGLAG